MIDRRKPKKRLYADWWYAAREELDRAETEKKNNDVSFYYAYVFIIAMGIGMMVTWFISVPGR